MSGDAVIAVEGLVTRFGDQTVHDGLDLAVRRGEILGVIGPSGSGKSVLLRQIVGLDRPAAGRIAVFGVDVLSAPPAQRAGLERRWGVMFQDGALFSTLSVLENVEAPLREHAPDIGPGLRVELARLKLALAGLPPEAALKRPFELSGGMRKRAALARALALDPELLFLDEPTAGLDPVTAGRFDRLMADLARSLDLTVFLVTHDLDTLFAICDRVAVILHGRIAAIGPAREVQAAATGWIADYFCGPRGRAAGESAGRT